MKHIKECATSRLAIAAIDSEWWDSLSKEEQKEYIKKHPKSKYAKQSSTPAAKKPVSKTGLGKSSYVDWERDVTDIIAEEMEITNSDAQGFMETPQNSSLLGKLWANKKSASDAAKELLKNSR